MNKIKLTYLTMALFAMILSDAAWARDGHGGSHGDGHHHAGGGGHHHASVGHRHFGGGHRHRHRRHSHLNLGFNIGGYNSGFYGSNFGFGYGYRDPFFYRRPYNYGPTVVVPMTPPVYIQREEVQPAQPQTNYWHYCQDPDGYYPYVKQCPGGWLQVAPQPLTQ